MARIGVSQDPGWVFDGRDGGGCHTRRPVVCWNRFAVDSVGSFFAKSRLNLGIGEEDNPRIKKIGTLEKKMSLMNNHHIDDMPVIKDIKEFDTHSGIWLERVVFNHRLLFIIVCALITVVLGYQASKVKVSASFDKMIPQNHPYTKNYFQNKDELAGLGDAVRVVVETKKGQILDPEYLNFLRDVSDALLLMPGVDRAWMKSLWTPNVRWMTVTEEGFAGGPVMPKRYNGSAESLAELQTNISNAGIRGSLIGLDNKSSMIVVPLLEKDSQTGQPLDYRALSSQLEKIRSKQTDNYRIYIVGFAKLVGDFIDGLMKVMMFFGVAILIAAVLVYLYTRCVRSTVTLGLCSLIAVVWLIGLLVTVGADLNPYSILVPFLVFAIGISHGAQKMNGIMQDIGRGTQRLVAARYTFRRLFLAGLTALLADTVGFAVLMIIDIPIIKELALTASMGVAILIFTNLLLLPVMLSFIGVSHSAAERSLREESDASSLVARASVWLSMITRPRPARFVVGLAVLLAVVGGIVGYHSKIGDLDPGAPELRPNSRYNQDNAYIISHYALSSDIFAVIVRTPPGAGLQYKTVVEMDRLGWQLQQLPAVQAVTSVSDYIKVMTSGACEASPKWYTIPAYKKSVDWAITYTLNNNPDLCNIDMTVMPVIAYLKDHKAETLQGVVQTCDKFAREHSTPDRRFLLAAGSAGIEASTNIVVEKANRTMMLYVYLAVIALCFITFHSWRAVLVAVIPLAITSILCEALMVVLGIGVKVATLPVIALGVGIGVDYALYLVSVLIKNQRDGIPLQEAYLKALRFTGRVVALVGVTLSFGVLTWAFSPIKFQADMGILLSFMFLWNMVGALVLIPALSHFIMQTKWVAKRVPEPVPEEDEKAVAGGVSINH